MDKMDEFFFFYVLVFLTLVTLRDFFYDDK